MRRRFSMVPAFLAMAGLLLLLPAVANAEVPTWKNRDGDAIEADPLSYDLESKNVTFQLENGSEIEYPLVDLDAESRFRVYSDPKIQESLTEQGWRFPPGYIVKMLLMVFGLVLAFSLTFGFVCFWMSARLVTGESGMGFHLGGFLKYLAASLILWVVGNTIIYWGVFSYLFSGDGQFDPEAISEGGNGLIQFVFWILSIGVPVFVISSHYQVGFLRSFVTLVVYGFVSSVAAFVLAILALIAIAAGAPVVEEYGYGEYLLDAWFLEPIGIL